MEVKTFCAFVRFHLSCLTLTYPLYYPLTSNVMGLASVIIPFFSLLNHCTMVHDGLITVSYVLYHEHETHKYIHLYEERSQVSSLLYIYGLFSLSLALRKRMARLSQKTKRVSEMCFFFLFWSFKFSHICSLIYHIFVCSCWKWCCSRQ